jgi:neutral ceramidase
MDCKHIQSATSKIVSVIPLSIPGKGITFTAATAFFFLLCAGVTYSCFGQNGAPGTFRASVVKVDITPSDPQQLAGYAARKSTGVMHEIYHRIVAMDDGNTQFFLVSTEIGKMAPSQYDKVAKRLKDELGIDPNTFWWTVTHTHSAPEIGPPGLSGIFLPSRYEHAIANKYTGIAEQKLIDGIKEARNKLAAARIGMAWGFSQANINRRAIDADGRASLGLNPDGATDRRIGMLRLEKADGTPLAFIANYAIHGTVMGPQNLEISGDAPGVVMDYVEEKAGAPLLFINGAAGNLAPIYSVYPSARAGHLSQFRVLLGDRILEANDAIASTTDKVNLTARTLIVETPRKEMGWPDDMASYSRTTPSGKNMVLLPVRFLKINEDLAIWSAPLELFCEISNQVRALSPFAYTFYFGYSNGNLGYLPTAKGWQEGGYEPGVSPFTPQAEKDLVESVAGYLEGELRAPSKIK